MIETPRDNPHIELVLISIRRFRDGTLDIAGLQQNLSAVMGAMEGDMPKSIRDALFTAEAEIDSIRFTVDEAQQSTEVDQAVSELEELIADYMMKKET